MTELVVKIPLAEAGSYRVQIGSHILGSLWPKIEAEFKGLNKFVVTDENVVSAGHLETLLAGADTPTFVISPAGEVSKNISTVVSIIEAMEKQYFG